MGILLHKAGRLPVAELFWGMQGRYPRHFVLYGSGFTAEQSEAIGASSLPAETLKPGGVHGELIPCSLGPSTAGPDAARHKGRGFVR